jgi:hypothetical protein
MPAVGTKQTKQNDYVAAALAVHRQQKAKQPEDAAAAVIVVPLTPSRKTKVVTVASEPRRSARLMAKQQLNNENNGQELQNNDNMAAIGNIVAVENAAMAAPDAAPVLLPPPPIHQRGVHWPEEAVVLDVLVYDNERPAPSSSSCGNWFMNYFFLVVLVALFFAGVVPSHNAAESTAVAIRTVFPTVAFLPRGGMMEEQSVGGEPDDEWWSSSANRTLALVPRRHNAAASSAVAIHTVIPSELPLFFLPRVGGMMEEQSVGGDPYDEWRSVVPPNETAVWSRVAHRAFPSDRNKRQPLTTKQHIVRNATRDDWINMIIEQVHGTAIWEWVDVTAPPATCV